MFLAETWFCATLKNSMQNWILLMKLTNAFMIFLTRGTHAVLYLIIVWYLMDVFNKCPLYTELKHTLQTGSVCVKGCLCTHDCAVFKFIIVIVMLIFKLIFLKNGWISY
jgi:hypothetical protein